MYTEEEIKAALDYFFDKSDDDREKIIKQVRALLTYELTKSSTDALVLIHKLEMEKE